MTIAKAAVISIAVAICLTSPTAAKTVTADGVVIFTQADVNAGNITLGDTPGFPATLSVSGNYRLGSALTVTTLKNAIVVAAPAVSIDLNKFKISGSNAGRTGIFSNQIDTSIANGIIRSFTEYGISVTGNNLRVDRVDVAKSGFDGISAYYSNRARIADSIVSENGGIGISCGSGCSVQNSTITDNGNDGIFSYDTGSFLANVITGNDRYGIEVFASGAFGNNLIFANTLGPRNGPLASIFPNACSPSCP